MQKCKCGLTGLYTTQVMYSFKQSMVATVVVYIVMT